MKSIQFYAFALSPTPTYGTENFPSFYQLKDGLPLDDQGLFRPLEFVARTGTLFKVLQVFENDVWKVRCRDYPADVFVDKRFLQITSQGASERDEPFPNPKEILKKLNYFVSINVPYIWGGNDSNGIPKMPELFPPPNSLDGPMEKIWNAKGFDCTGMLYQLCNGMRGKGLPMPRNSSDVIKLGIPVLIEGKTAKQIAISAKFLDIIGWKGHVLIVGKGGIVFDCLLGHGAIATPLVKRVQKIMQTRKPVNEYAQDTFVMRRWYPF